MTNKAAVRRVHPIEDVYVKITWWNGRELSIVGDSPRHYGQISGDLIVWASEHPHSINQDDGWDLSKIQTLCDVWDRWHLNDMRAGTPRQEDVVRTFLTINPNCDYDEICDYLKLRGLYEDDGYTYGTSWLVEEVPQIVLEWLFSLPGEGDSTEDLFSHSIADQDFESAILNT